MSPDELAPTETAPVVADVTPAPIPSDAELEAIVRERMPDNLRDSRYPRAEWQSVIRSLLRWAWSAFLLYLAYVGQDLATKSADGPITWDTVAHTLLLGRILPFLHDAPFFALVVPVALLALVVLAGWWANRDMKREKALIARQNQWVRHAVTEERARMQAQADTEEIVGTLKEQGDRIETGTTVNTALGVATIVQGETIRDEVTAVHVDVRATKITVEEIAERQRQAAADKAPLFTRVRDLDRVSFRMGDRAAATFPYVRKPVEDIYQQAVATLTAASADQSQKQGILVIGAANAGKTRLALEALIAALLDWDTLVWNVGDDADRIPTMQQLAGRNVAVFLDDIQNYAAGGAIASGVDGRSAQASVAGPGATLQTLYQRICQEATQNATHVVFVATCRREKKEAAKSSLGWLFEKLEEVAVPTFNSHEDSAEAREIIDEFAQEGEVRDEWDGTLGSLVLGLGRKHEEYVELTHQHNPENPAVPVLRAMKLLTIGGVFGLTGRRVRAVCAQILHEPALANADKPWDDALAELKRLEFVSITAGEGDVTLEISKDDYFTYVVADYPADYQLQQHRASLLDTLVSFGDDDGLFDLGNGFYFNDQFLSAITAYQEAIRLNPTYATAYNNMGNTLGKLGRHDEAITAYQEAIRLNPTYATAYYNMGNTLGKLGRHDEAITAYQEAIRLNPTYATAYYNMGNTLGKLERYDEALEAFNQAINLDPNYAGSWRNKSLTLALLSRFDEALDACGQAMERNPRDATTWHVQAAILRELGREDEARAAEERAKQLEEQL